MKLKKYRRLPEGTWCVGFKKEARKSSFWMEATEAATGDLARLRVCCGDLSGYERSDWSLPADIPLNRLWYLRHLEPRVQRARGGTKAILLKLTEIADRCDAWCFAEVRPHDFADEPIVIKLMSRYGFKRCHTDVEFLLHRPPSKRS